ncbi:Mitochondrial phosphate carrier protein 3 [Nymphaea thermarum]|nr:Mitochondrial phosphate carrier protein 3 [Nymphaea thermarum]
MSALDFYIACILGGSLSSGLTHAGVTPLDVIKCNMQANPSRHVSMGYTLQKVLSKYGAGALFKGWVPTLLGYSVQGAVKYGLYEFFKVECAGMAGNHEGHKALVFMVGSAWSELISDVFLCPFEAVKLRVQTHPSFGITFPQAALEIVRSQGFKGLYSGLLPLWGRQIPYSVVKFACFEKTLEGIYKYVLCTPKEECPKGVQLGVSFLAGYVSGVACALASHPADNLVSLMNNCDGGSVSLQDFALACSILAPSAEWGFLFQALQKMGLVSLCTKGLWLRILMVGTMSGAQWGIYDAFKVMSGHDFSEKVALGYSRLENAEDSSCPVACDSTVASTFLYGAVDPTNDHR